MPATQVALKVGDLARQAGVSVRALHHYDAIGLLSPTHRSAAGYRLYGAQDVVRLQQIRSLRQLGFALEEIRGCLENPAFSPLRVVELHLARLQEQLALQRTLCEHLETLAAHLRSAEDVSVETLLSILEAMSMVEKYYTKEQLAELARRREEIGADGLRQAEADWRELIAQVRAEMDQGTDPTSARVQRLAQRWIGLVRGFTGGDPGIAEGLGRMWQEEQTIHGLETAPMREMGDYISKALAAKKPE